MREQSLRIAVLPVIALLLAAHPGAVAGQDSTPQATTPDTGAAAVATPRPVDDAAPDATATAAAASRARAACEAQAQAIVDPKQTGATVKQADVLALGRSVAELVICSAVLNDSADICRRFFPNEQGPSGACLQTQSIFHELRTEPKKHTFMFTERDWQQCRGIKEAQGFCDSLRTALRSGDVEQCTTVGDGEGICRAYMTLDKQHCAVTGELAEVTFSLPDHKEGEPTSFKVGEIAVEDCRARIDSRAFLAKGLEALAASGPTREQMLARAALQQPDACAPRVEEAIESCLARERGTGQPDGGTGAGSGAPAAPKP